MASTNVPNYALGGTHYKESTESKINSPTFLGASSAAMLMVAAASLVQPVFGLTPDSAFDITTTNNKFTITETIDEIDQYIAFDLEKDKEYKILSFLNFEKNWDGYDGIPASNKTSKNALSFLKKLPMNVYEPRPALAGDGEISLFWEFDNIFVDIGFSGDETYVMYAKDQDGIEYFKDEVSLNDSLPEALMNLIIIK